MREIEFRAKNINDQWRYGYLERQDLLYDENYDCSSSVQIETLGQYTGLTDKNGTKIFEGDFIKANHNVNFYKVYWQDCRFYIEDEWGNLIKPKQTAINHFECEVIGNIHDNPEFLGESDE